MFIIGFIVVLIALLAVTRRGEGSMLDRYEAMIGRAGDRFRAWVSNWRIVHIYRRLACHARQMHEWSDWQPLPEASVYTLGRVCIHCGMPHFWPE